MCVYIGVYIYIYRDLSLYNIEQASLCTAAPESWTNPGHCAESFCTPCSGVTVAQALFTHRSLLLHGFVDDDDDDAAELTPVVLVAGSSSPRWRRGARAGVHCCHGRHTSVVASAAALGQL